MFVFFNTISLLTTYGNCNMSLVADKLGHCYRPFNNF